MDLSRIANNSALWNISPSNSFLFLCGFFLGGERYLDLIWLFPRLLPKDNILAQLYIRLILVISTYWYNQWLEVKVSTSYDHFAR